MTDLIPLDAAIGAIERWWMCSQTTWQSPMTILRALPTIDPAAIREAALREAARIIVTHEMGTPMHSPPQLLTEAHDRILALIGEKK